MTVAAAARNWWAATGRPSRQSPPPGTGNGSNHQVARVTAFPPLLLASAIIVCAAVGFTVTQFSAYRLQAERHAAFQEALDEFRATSGATERFDDAQVRQIERRAGVKDLRFAVDPASDAGRELQSVHDARGRIVGWFSWTAEGALVGALDRLWGLLAAVGAALGLGACLGMGVSRQRVRSLDLSTQTARKLSSQDALTGLPDHRMVLAMLDDALARRRSGVVAFARIDLDGFREINEALGRAGGDAVLRDIAEHLQAALPAGALFGRFEEDEFAVIASGDDPRLATSLIESLRASLQRPIFVDRMWQISAGIGVAQAPEDGAAGEDVARRAGLALRAAKREGRGRTRAFAPQIETEHAERRFLLRELQTAISLQAFDVYYQPVVAAEGGAIVGVEALLRWLHPRRGVISPSVFIPLAEQSGLMSQLGEIVLRRALADAMRWPDLSVAVNLSPLQIRDRWLVDLVGAVMAETGIASSRVVLEVTEGVLIDNPQEAQAKLEALRGLGVSIALDDFGTGYSSLSYLQKFAFDRLKIDRAFVASLGASGTTGAIIQAIVTLGHALGMKVLAEGVENDEQRVLLRLAGCDEMQGYLFARPAPAAEIDKALARSVRALAAG